MAFAADGSHPLISNGIDKIDFRDYSPSLDGSAGDSDKFFKACHDAYAYDVPLILPAGTINISKMVTALPSIQGAAGRTRLVIDKVVDTSAESFKQFIFRTPWRKTYNETTAQRLFLRDFDVEFTPMQEISVFGFANVKGLHIENVNITANYALNPANSRPYRVDSLIDLYACVKNARITRCALKNITYAHGADTPWDAGGGGEIWVRNLCDSAAVGADIANATENIWIDRNYFEHNTSDEAIAVFGVVGMVQKVLVNNNIIKATDIDTSKLCYHNSLLTAFPLKHATLGTNASVQDIDFVNNIVDDRSFFYSVFRFGNSSDNLATNLCRRIRSIGNKVTVYINPDATYSPHATWSNYVTADTDPAISSLIFRAVQVTGTFGSYKDAGLTSSNDSVVTKVGSDTVFTAFNGFDAVSNPTTLGSIWYALSQCSVSSGGDIEAVKSCFHNVKNVTGGNVKSNIDTSNIFSVDVDSTYNFSGVRFSSSGQIVNITAGVTADIVMSGCAGGHGNAALYAITQDSTLTYMRSHANVITGTMAGKADGAGSVTSSLNKYGATID